MKIKKWLGIGYQFFRNIKLQFWIGCLFILALSMSLTYCSEKLMGDDFWWHVKVGEWIWKHHSVPTMGIFSWYAIQEKLNWFAHEWLSGFVLYGFREFFGDYGYIAYILPCFVCIFLLLYGYCWRMLLQNYAAFLLWAVLGFFYEGKVALARPHMLGLCFFTAYLIILEKIDKNRQGKKWIYLVPVLACLWANCHGGSANLLYILPVIFLLSGCRKNKFLKIKFRKYKKEQIKAYLFCILSGIAGICINPRGIELLLYPYTYSNDSTKYIQEWMSPAFKGNADIFVLLILIALVWILTEKQIQAKDLLLGGAFIVLTLMSIRFVAWLYIAATVSVVPYIKRQPGLRKHDSLQLMVTVFSLVLLIALPFQKTEKEINAEAVYVIKNEKYGKLYNSYHLGDCLIYEDIEVFFDGRSDLYYPDGSLEDGILLNQRESSDKKKRNIIKKYGFDFFVTEPDSGLKEYLGRHKRNYKLVYKDEKCVIYKKII